MKDKTAYAAYQESGVVDRFSGMRGSNLVYRTSGSRDKWKNVETNTTVKDFFSRTDYDYFRPNESVATKPKAIIEQCMEAYRQTGLLRNVVDLMADFGSQGIHLKHPNPRIQKFFRDWYIQVNGPERSERFLNLFYRSGNVFLRRTNAKITAKIAKNMRGYADTQKPAKKERISKKTIPWKYTFLSPNLVEVLGGELSRFVGVSKYGLKIPSSLYSKIRNPSNQAERELISKIPNDIVAAIRRGDKILPLDAENIVVKYYKKDDWQLWADPMLYSILDDVIMLEKLKLADRAALDGIISQVRLWRIGDIEHELFPNDAAIDKLINILSSNPGGGPFDIVWGPELNFDETSTEAYKFLGKAKYEPTLNDIHAGLGVPATLTGSGEKSGLTNNFVSLKTIVKRLEYGRSMLTSWWNEEIYRVQQAMGFKFPAEVKYDRMILTDEAAEKALIRDLWDRHLITDSTILERYGEDPEMENRINKRETKERDENKRPQKAGPYHIAEKEHELNKLSLGKGYLKPSQVGLDVEESYEKEPFMEALENRQTPSQKGNEKDPDSTKDSPGRPFNSKDSEKRTRTVKPRTDAAKILWANYAQDEIDRILNPHLLSFFNKSSLRKLSAVEAQHCENIKFAILSQIDSGSDIVDDDILDIAKSGQVAPSEFITLYHHYTCDQNLGIKDRKLYKSIVHSELK